MSLQEKLDAMKAASQERIPAEVKAIMKQSLEQLAASGRKEQALKVGDQVPEFCLQEGFGNSYSSAELIKQGPLVLNFFRGFW